MNEQSLPRTEAGRALLANGPSVPFLRQSILDIEKQAAASPAPDRGLDVERLANAMRREDKDYAADWRAGNKAWTWEKRAERIARAYEAEGSREGR